MAGGNCDVCGKHVPSHPTSKHQFVLRVFEHGGAGDIVQSRFVEVRNVTEWLELTKAQDPIVQMHTAEQKLGALFYQRPRERLFLWEAVMLAAAHKKDLVIYSVIDD